MDIYDTPIAITLTGSEWRALCARILDKRLSVEGALKYKAATTKIEQQIRGFLDDEKLKRAEPATPDAVERYKGFVIHQSNDGGYTWSRGNIARTPFASVSEVRADIDAYLAAAGQ